ncbi:hypothetical protein LAZ67_1006804 [Cordylochernes scorpioides]|uniref:CCHC-type domain-containing protein n=1 Tax=Cordylochernes scorpioides TaxID=51811 RepID=A0ABY6JZN6_9ARAC|nr:hypothetical protein LAZ67_1006804 [Cordylochernes scorpioides]
MVVRSRRLLLLHDNHAPPFSPPASGRTSRKNLKFILAESTQSAAQVPERPSVQSQPGDKISPKERIEKNSSKEFSMEFQRNADPPARETHARPAAARDDVTPSLAASLSYNSAARAPGNWADCAEDLRPGSDDSFTVVKSRKRRRESAGSPTAAAPTSNAGGSRTIRRPQSSAGSVPRAQEIRVTRAHIAEARARQASSSEEHCVYIEHSPELEPFHYLRALDRMLGGTAGVIQITKVNGHQLLGLTNRGLAERLISEGLEVDGTLLRVFPFRKRAERITVGNLPFFVGDSAIINALSPYGRVTSIAPKQMKAGPYVYVDGRRDVFITLHEGITIERLPTRLDINIKGEAWPAYLSSGIRCSRCHGQGHRRAICPLLAGLANNTRSAPPTSPAGVLPPTTPAPPQRSATQPSAPAPSNPAMETPGASPAARAVTPSAAPRPSTPVASAVPMEMAPPAPPPKAPAPEHPASPRSAATEPTPPARPDFTTPCGPLPAQGTLGPATHTPDVDMTSTEKTSASSPAAVISTLPLPAPRPAEPTPPAPRRESAPAMAAPPPPPSAHAKDDPVPDRWKVLKVRIKESMRGPFSNFVLDTSIYVSDIVEAVQCPEKRESFLAYPSPRQKIFLAQFLEAVIEHTQDMDPSIRRGLSEIRAALPTSRKITKLILAESPQSAEQVPERLSVQSQPGEKISPKESIEENSSKEFSMEYQRGADPPAREMHASLAAARDDVTVPLIAASCSASTANPAPLIWGDTELAEMDDNDAFTVVRTKKRRRDSPVLPAMAAQSNSAGASRRQRSSTGWIPPVQEIRTTTAHVMEARARQASCTEEQCLYLEYCPDYQSYQYLRAIERVVGGPKNIFQFSKINGHYLLGLASKSLAEHLVREGLEIEGTLIRTFPFRKSSTRITVGNLPFFVADAAIIDALSRYGRITSIAPKLLKAGEFTYTDGRREVFILLHDGITIDKLPTRFEIRIKGEAWPAFLSHGIKCSKCHGQGHRRANCPQLHGRSTTARRASPPPSTDLPPSTAPGLPRQSSAAPPAPAPPSPSNKASRAPSDSCAASLPSAAPWPSTPAPPASPMQAVTPAPPPMTPSPEDPMGPRSAASRPEPTPPARPDFTTPYGPLPAQGTHGPATHTPDVDMTTTEETSAS